MNVFDRDLDWSHDQAEDPAWEAVYRNAFPTFAGMQYIAKDGWSQRKGVDRRVFLTDGSDYTVDEKARRGAWPDILIEIWSDEKNRKEGWIFTHGCDYIAYLFVPTSTCYLLPRVQLQAAYKQNKAAWRAWARASVRGFREVRAENRGYTTMSIAVPIEDLLDAVRDCMIVKAL